MLDFKKSLGTFSLFNNAGLQCTECSVLLSLNARGILVFSLFGMFGVET